MPPTEQARLPASSLSAVSPSKLSQWFATEVKPCEPALRAYLLKRFPSLPDHDDLVQEAYTRLVRARESGRLTYAKAFLFTVARNVAIDLFRRRRTAMHEPLSELTELPALEEPAGVGETLDRQQRLELLVEAVATLPERCRQVMMLRHLDGLAYKQIAERLGISPETVKVHMIKGVRDCTAFFRQHGLLDGDAATGTMGTTERAIR
jgi:RNA polymerase sigma factor (sigma-70 family)